MKPAIGAATPIVPLKVTVLPPESIVRLSVVALFPSPTIVELKSIVPSVPAVSVSISTAPEITTAPLISTLLLAALDVVISPLKVIVLPVNVTVLISSALPIAPTARVPVPALIVISSELVPPTLATETAPLALVIVRSAASLN